MPEAFGRIERLADPRRGADPGRRWRGGRERRARARRRRIAARRRQLDLRRCRARGRVSAAQVDRRMSLERALALVDASPGRGYPNPTVGAVVVTPDGATIGEGVSEPAGGPHAEVIALDAAGDGARGATLFVTMEPCAHHGRTPPCVDRIVAAGIARVVAGCRDPNPIAGSGDAMLAAAGVRDRAARPARGPSPERGVADVDRPRPAPRDAEACDLARRPRRRARAAVGDRRRVATSCPCAACGGRRRLRRYRDRACGRPAPRRTRRRGRAPAATPRIRARPAARRLRARAPYRADRGRARGARRRGRPVAAPRGRADDRGLVPA